MGSQAHLGHTLRTPKLVDELVQRVDWQLPAQRSHLGKQTLFQPFYPFHDTRALQVSLKWVQGTSVICGVCGGVYNDHIIVYQGFWG